MPPPEDVGDESAHHRSERQPGISAGRNHADGPAAPGDRIGRRHQGQRTRQHERRAHALEESLEHDHVHGSGESQGKGQGGKDDQSGQKHPALADDVPQPAESEHAHGHGQHVKLFHQPQLHGRGAEFPAQGGQGHPHRRDHERGHELGNADGDEHEQRRTVLRSSHMKYPFQSNGRPGVVSLRFSAFQARISSR